MLLLFWKTFWLWAESLLTGHTHDWDLWKKWGVTYQSRVCKTCGYKMVVPD